MIISIVALVMSAPENAQTSTGSTGQYTVAPAAATSAQGGNVTAVNVSADVSTSKWQGYWGNITGSLQLGTGATIFYNWSGVQFQAVYASPGSDVDFATITDLNTSANLTAKDTDYGFTASDTDSINNTMSGNTCTAGTIFTAAAGVTPYNSTGGASSWTTCIGEDAGGLLDDTLFGTNIVQNGADAFNGQTVQYQLMVPVIAAGDSYYFFLEV